MKILVLNGPNLNLLGARSKQHYGTFTINDLEKEVKQRFPEHEFVFFQSNEEGSLIDRIQNAADKYNALILNPGGYAHTSVAIRDALELCSIPKIEVHLSNLSSREDFRQQLITASVCDGYISGFKVYGYLAAVFLIEEILKR